MATSISSFFLGFLYQGAAFSAERFGTIPFFFFPASAELTQFLILPFPSLFHKPPVTVVATLQYHRGNSA